MKKTVFFLLCVLTLSACHFLDKDDDRYGNPYGYEYMYRPCGGMVDLCDVTVTYYKADGTQKTDTVDSDKWYKINYFTQGDVNVGYRVDLKAKDSCKWYTKDTSFHFHHYCDYKLSVKEGVWTNVGDTLHKWDEMYDVDCPITKDSLQRLLDQHFTLRGIHFYLDSNYNLTEPN